jgi:hypothetical protein
MTEEYTLDPQTWYSQRELEFTPAHFVQATTRLTEVSKQWVLDKLKGRFVVITTDDTYFLTFMTDGHSLGKIAFEDPQEAIFYELTWS